MIRCGTTSIASGGRRSSFLRRHPRSLTQFTTGLQTQAQKHNSSSSFSPRRFLTWYSAKLDTHPLTTKCISAGLISSVANILAQGIAFQQQQTPTHSQHHDDTTVDDENTKNTSSSSSSSSAQFWNDFRIDPHQVGRFAFLNVVFVAPVLHHWYNFLNKAIPGVTWGQVIRRTFWDEFVFSPLYIPVFLGSLWRLEGTDVSTIQTMMVRELPGIVVAEWTLWIPTMLVTFRYAPVKYQVLVINCVGVVWQTFLSFMAARAHISADQHNDKINEEVSLYLETVVGPESSAATADKNVALRTPLPPPPSWTSRQRLPDRIRRQPR